MGAGAGPTYLSTSVLTRAMARYNAALLQVCKSRGVECVDAAALVPRDTSMMWDEDHFTDAGSQTLAAGLVTYLKGRPPWGGGVAPIRSDPQR
jgi:hypothetical protein